MLTASLRGGRTQAPQPTGTCLQKLIHPALVLLRLGGRRAGVGVEVSKAAKGQGERPNRLIRDDIDRRVLVPDRPSIGTRGPKNKQTKDS